jgi:hypothetical protein
MLFSLSMTLSLFTLFSQDGHLLRDTFKITAQFPDVTRLIILQPPLMMATPPTD